MLSTPESVTTIRRPPFADEGIPTQFLERHWTKKQLQAAAEMDRSVQRHPQHMLARLALANRGNSLDLERIRANVVRSLGGCAGTYYMVAALHLAHLALTYPDALSATQRALLLAPLEAAEMAWETTDDVSGVGEIAA